jgi:hypothetical protein
MLSHRLAPEGFSAIFMEFSRRQVDDEWLSVLSGPSNFADEVLGLFLALYFRNDRVYTSASRLASRRYPLSLGNRMTWLAGSHEATDGGAVYQKSAQAARS